MLKIFSGKPSKPNRKDFIYLEDFLIARSIYRRQFNRWLDSLAYY